MISTFSRSLLSYSYIYTVKILLLTDGIFPYQIGGMQRHSTLLVDLLAKNKIYVHVVHCGGINYSSINFFNSFPTASKEYIAETKVDFPHFKKLPGHYIRENRAYSKKIFQTFQADLKNFDLVYAQGFTGSYFIKNNAIHKLPVLVNLHGLEMFQFAPNLKTKLQYQLLIKEAKRNLFGADYVYSFGGKLNGILNKIGVPSFKIIEHSNGIPEEYVLEEILLKAKKTTGINFVFIGRNERRKGVEELRKALVKLIEKHPIEIKFNFNFIGPINDSTKLIHPNIHYHGEIRDTEKIKAILDGCDCLVCPSYAEGMPTVILEAMARGLVIIATDVGATSRLINGNGILLENPAVDKLIKAMDTIIELPENELGKMKSKSIQLIKEKFTWNRVIQSKIKDFEKIIG